MACARIRQWLAHLTTARGGRRPAELIEPFAGGASVALAAVIEGLVDRAILVELDPDIAAVWQVIIGGDAAWLANEVAGFDIHDEANVRRILESRPTGTRRRAFRCLLANRVSRGGVIAPGAGIVDQGENGRGIASRWYASTLCDRIRCIAEHASRLKIIHGDGLDYMQRHAGRTGTAWFIDPPYSASGKQAGARLYTHWEIDHTRLFKLAARLRGPFLATYEHGQGVLDLAREHGLVVKAVVMSSAHNHPATELLIARELAWDTTALPAASSVADSGPHRHGGPTLPIAEIKIAGRVRQELGDIAGLSGSLKQCGLLQPVVVTVDNALVAGQRRLEAARLAGWTEIPIRVVHGLDAALDALRAEEAENRFRKPLTVSESLDVARRLEELERAAARKRQAAAGPREGRGRKRGAVSG